jgi:hypothetical protein
MYAFSGLEYFFFVLNELKGFIVTGSVGIKAEKKGDHNSNNEQEAYEQFNGEAGDF